MKNQMSTMNVFFLIAILISLGLSIAAIVLQLNDKCPCKKEDYADQYFSMKAVKKNPKCKFYDSYSKERYGSGSHADKGCNPTPMKEDYIACRKYPKAPEESRYEEVNEGYREDYECGCKHKKKKK